MTLDEFIVACQWSCFLLLVIGWPAFLIFRIVRDLAEAG